MSAGEKSKRPKSGTPRANAARQRAAQAVSLPDALAEAAWSQADAALAQALADYDEAATAKGKSARNDALERLGQSLAQAARKRGLARSGKLAAKVAFDPGQHDLDATVVKPPKNVRIRARGVTRGDEVLAKPRVAPAKQKKRS